MYMCKCKFIDEQKATKVMLEEMDEGKGLQHVEALCEEEGENSLDSSMEEAELGESSPREAGLCNNLLLIV